MERAQHSYLKRESAAPDATQASRQSREGDGAQARSRTRWPRWKLFRGSRWTVRFGTPCIFTPWGQIYTSSRRFFNSNPKFSRSSRLIKNFCYQYIPLRALSGMDSRYQRLESSGLIPGLPLRRTSGLVPVLPEWNQDRNPDPEIQFQLQTVQLDRCHKVLLGERRAVNGLRTHSLRGK